MLYMTNWIYGRFWGLPGNYIPILWDCLDHDSLPSAVVHSGRKLNHSFVKYWMTIVITTNDSERRGTILLYHRCQRGASLSVQQQTASPRFGIIGFHMEGWKPTGVNFHDDGRPLPFLGRKFRTFKRKPNLSVVPTMGASLPAWRNGRPLSILPKNAMKLMPGAEPHRWTFWKQSEHFKLSIWKSNPDRSPKFPTKFFSRWWHEIIANAGYIFWYLNVGRKYQPYLVLRRSIWCGYCPIQTEDTLRWQTISSITASPAYTWFTRLLTQTSCSVSDIPFFVICLPIAIAVLFSWTGILLTFWSLVTFYIEGT